MTQTPLVEAGRFECPVCAERLQTVGEKKRHIRETHPKESTR